MVSPVSIEVIGSSLQAYCDEMASVLCRTAYSPIIFEVRDFCVGLVDPDGQIIAQNKGGLPIFLADMGFPVLDAIKVFGRENLKPGDIILTNHPYICGQHLNNVILFSPFFHKGEIVAFPAVRAHWVHIGGVSAGFGSSDTTEIYQEGLQLRSIKLYESGKPNETILRILKDNIKYPDLVFGDMNAQISSCKVGERRLANLFDKYGKETIVECIHETWNRSEELARMEIAKIPNGSYTSESFLDNDGVDLDKTIPIKVTVTIEDQNMIMDFSEMSDQTKGPINSATIAAARVAFKCVSTPTTPVNEGCFRPLEVIIPPGKLMNALPPASMAAFSMPFPTVIDTVLRALSSAIPDKIPAAHFGSMGGHFILQGKNKKTGKPFVCFSHYGGGWGGRPIEDGVNSSGSICQGLVQNASVELEELYYPMIFERLALRVDQAGAGKFRGGLGIEVIIKCLQDSKLNENIERSKCHPWGLQGGKDGSPNMVRVKSNPQAEWQPMLKIHEYPLEEGALVWVQTGCGGGWGNPLERNVELIQDDVQKGFISLNTAQREYKVVINPETLAVDNQLTQALRKK